MKQLVLDGVKVVDFSWVMAGPMTTKLLGGMGAEIIKIESTKRPEFSKRDGWFAVINNNKKSCTINIRSSKGQELIRSLVARSDVVVENFSSRVLKSCSLTYHDLRKIRPNLIFVSASGVGREGPQRDLLAYGTLLQSYSGRVSLIGEPNPELEAMGISPAWTDPITAFWEVLAILAALRHRGRTGAGSYIDLSMLESTVALLPESLLRSALGAQHVPLGGDGEIGAAPSGCFRCRGEDAWLAVSVRGEAQWQGLCAAMERPELVLHERYADAFQRWRNRSGLNEELAMWARDQDAAHAEALLQRHNVPAARSRSIFDVMEDAHIAARGVYDRLGDHGGTITLPWRDSESWRGRFAPTPALGADNGYVFGQLLGLSEAEQVELAEAGVIE